MSREEHNSQPPGKITDDKFPPPCKKCMQIPGGVAGGGWAMIELTPALTFYYLRQVNFFITSGKLTF